MTVHVPDRFLSGVIEGFYGPPWSRGERLELLEWMSRWGLDTYFYGPKDDLKCRAIWRESYEPAETEALAEMIGGCQARQIRFVHALSPGLDIRYSDPGELEHLQRRFGQMLALGCQDFSLLFDDIPDQMDPADLGRWGTLAAAQCHVANEMFLWVRQRSPDARFLFCPTPYCGRMAASGLGGPGYLDNLGRELLPGIDVFWTGPEIISAEITVEHVREVAARLRRKPLIWDNLHANDYDGHRFYCGPYSGRAPELRGEIAGILSNPNTEFPLNQVPLHTLAKFVHSRRDWDPRRAYLEAMEEWLPSFATIGVPLALEDLILFGDCYYLPYEDGASGAGLYEMVRRLLAQDPADWGPQADEFRRLATRLRTFCMRLTELSNRPLFHALHRRVWELREELDLLDRYVVLKSASGNPNASFDFHLPGTYRGGMVARLQRLLVPAPDGGFVPARMTVNPGAQTQPNR